ncbi:PIN domain-containing protein [Sphingomonas sp. HT-1]|uniref:PIN domain-containing protein n=1 Tax=unclassified Sphingomonas TaxID=196159 RepID=UPI0002ED3079|nr:MULTISPECIES: PIN domain-containing protein [unclassified Sphingomonas]KTF70499.1 twitching motility protein PilT [Sphingomonas sp. WG]
MYLLDTPVVLDLRKAKGGQGDPRLAAWAAGVPREQLFVSALTLAEIEALAVVQGAQSKEAAAALRRWIDAQLVPAFDGHILAIDRAIARRRGQVAIAGDRAALIAATALEQGLTLVTFDLATYRGARIKLFDPRRYDPAEAEPEAGDWRAAAKSGPAWLRNLFIRG